MGCQRFCAGFGISVGGECLTLCHCYRYLSAQGVASMRGKICATGHFKKCCPRPSHGSADAQTICNMPLFWQSNFDARYNARTSAKGVPPNRKSNRTNVAMHESAFGTKQTFHG
jgi:hypothetical protein